MQNELFEVNTPDTLGVTPRFVLQHNAISRSAHNFSATAKKLTAMAMALLPPDLSSLTAAFTFAEFCKALGYERGGESFKVFNEAVKECMENVIKVETPPNKKGKTSWVMHHWFSRAEYNDETGICMMTFDHELANFLKELKWLYSKISLSDLGRLQSRYALRIYEFAISYSSMQGKNGNDSRSWYFDRTIPQLRQLFGINPDEYQENYEFRRRVIDAPVKEINDAGIGVEIKTEGIKKGRNLTGIRFDCKTVERTTRKRRGGKKTVSIPDPNPKTADTREEKELEHLKELYPKEFEELYTKALEELPTLGGSAQEFRKMAAEGKALIALKERHGIVK